MKVVKFFVLCVIGVILLMGKFLYFLFNDHCLKIPGDTVPQWEESGCDEYYESVKRKKQFGEASIRVFLLFLGYIFFNKEIVNYIKKKK